MRNRSYRINSSLLLCVNGSLRILRIRYPHRCPLHLHRTSGGSRRFVLVLFLGGKEFSIWPTSLNLSGPEHDVTIVDSHSRPKDLFEAEVRVLHADSEHVGPLNSWRAISGRYIRGVFVDVATEYRRLMDLTIEEDTGAVVHLLDQRAVSYSMKGLHQNRYTIDKNVSVTGNVLLDIA